MTLPDSDDLDTLGGAKVDYLAAPTDLTTDQGAAENNILKADVAAMTQTACRAWARFTLNGAGTPVLVAHASNWGADPGVAPSAARVSSGRFRVTWPATVTDELDEEHALLIRDAWVNVRGPYITYADVGTASNNRDVFIRDAAGTLTDGSGEAFTVFIT